MSQKSFLEKEEMSWVYQNIAFFNAMAKAKEREEEEKKKKAIAEAEKIQSSEEQSV